MNVIGILLAAAPNLTGGTQRAVFELGRIQSPLDWILPLLLVGPLSWFVIAMYRRDCRELGGRPAALLSGLRLLALLGILAIYLQPQWRARRDLVDRSRVLVLVDTSQSMQYRDAGTDTASNTASTGNKSRIEAVVDELSQGTLLAELRRVHDVSVYRFDETDAPTLAAQLPYVETTRPGAARPSQITVTELPPGVTRWRTMFTVAGIIGFFGLLAFGVYLARPKSQGPPPRWLLAAGSLALTAAAAVLIATMSIGPQPPLAALLGLSEEPLAPTNASPTASQNGAVAGTAAAPNWRELLTPRGAETRLGQALFQLVQDERSAPVAGIILLSDGQLNAGLSADAAGEIARSAEVPIYAVGLGSAKSQTLVRIASLQSHDRAYPGDRLEIKALVRSAGLAGRSVTARLRQVPLDEPGRTAAPSLSLDQREEVLLGSDQEDIPVKFDIPAIKLAGRYGFELSLEGTAVSGADAKRKFQIEIVDRKTKVLLIAGGPSREYRFVRNQLRRDKRITLDVWLQSSAVDKSQNDYPKNLAGFPESKEKLFDYDCIIALDPDWRDLDANQAALLEEWVARQAGGMIVAPGRVFAGSAVKSWVNEPKQALIRKLYPVEFQTVQFQADDVGRKWTQVQPLELTREGSEADFLRLDDDPAENLRTWNHSFAGVYGTLPVRGAKPAAAVYARTLDSRASAAGADPVFLAEQFYGSGRVFYIGSAEMWRLRELDPGTFERFYAQLIDHVSQQRLQRGARGGGQILLEKDEYHVGDDVPVVADLKNVRNEPLVADQVTLFITAPGAARGTPLKMLPDKTRAGMFAAQFVARSEGDYRLELSLPDGREEPLTKVFKVSTAALESRHPERNDDVLGKLARTTGGRYFIGLDAAMGRQSEPHVASLLKDRTQMTPVLGDRDPRWEAFWIRLMMFSVCGVLALEWLVRRLLKLA